MSKNKNKEKKKCYHLNEGYQAVLSYGSVGYAMQFGSNIWVWMKP